MLLKMVAFCCNKVVFCCRRKWHSAAKERGICCRTGGDCCRTRKYLLQKKVGSAADESGIQCRRKLYLLSKTNGICCRKKVASAGRKRYLLSKEGGTWPNTAMRSPTPGTNADSTSKPQTHWHKIANSTSKPRTQRWTRHWPCPGQTSRTPSFGTPSHFACSQTTENLNSCPHVAEIQPREPPSLAQNC